MHNDILAILRSMSKADLDIIIKLSLMKDEELIHLKLEEEKEGRLALANVIQLALDIPDRQRVVGLVIEALKEEHE